MTEPISSAGTERIPLHSRIAKPALYVMSGIYVLGAFGQVRSMLAHEASPLPSAVALLFGALLLLKMWSLYQRVYLTCEGIELTRPPHVVTWPRVGDAFRVPMTGSLAPICCIGIRDPENWDLHFMGRADFDQVVGEGRAKRHCPARPDG